MVPLPPILLKLLILPQVLPMLCVLIYSCLSTSSQAVWWQKTYKRVQLRRQVEVWTWRSHLDHKFRWSSLTRNQNPTARNYHHSANDNTKKPLDTKPVHVLPKQIQYESTELSKTHTKELLNLLILFVRLSEASAPHTGRFDQDVPDKKAVEPEQAIRPSNLVDNARLNAIQADIGEDYSKFVRHVTSLGIISKRIWPVMATVKGRSTVYQ